MIHGAGWGRNIAAMMVSAAVLAACGGEADVILDGERIPVRAESAAFLDVVEDAPALSIGDPEVNTRWTHENRVAGHSPGHVAADYPLTPVWIKDIGRGSTNEGRLTAGPVVGETAIYTMDAAGQVTATSPEGATLWSRSLAPESENPLDGFGGGLALSGDTLVATSGFARVVAMSAETGDIRWIQKTDAPLRAAPAILGDWVFAVARNDVALGLDIENGRIRWQTAGPEPIAGVVGGASPAAQGALVVLPMAAGEVVGVLARNGRRVWTAPVSGGRRGEVRSRISDITGDPVISGASVYVGNQSGQFSALDRRNGAPRWSIDEGALTPSLPVGRSLFMISDQGVLMRLNALDGAKIWARPLPMDHDGQVYTHSGPILVSGRILVASSDGQMRSFDPRTGADLGAVAIPDGGAAAQPAVAGGRVYVLTEGGSLVAYQ